MNQPDNRPFEEKLAQVRRVAKNTENISLGRSLNALLQEREAFLEALQQFSQLAEGWREAIVELEDWCSEPVRLKNMLAAADQISDLRKLVRAALAKAEGKAVPA